MNRRRKIHLSLGLIGVLWMLSPLLLDVASSISDAVFSFFVALGVCLLAFDDFEQEKTRSELLKVLAVAFVMFSAAAAVVLMSTGRGAMLIPLGVLGGGCLYWFIDKYVPASS